MTKKRKRLTTKDRRSQDLRKLVEGQTHAPEAELLALSCIVWAFRDCPDDVAGIVRDVAAARGGFTVDGATELIDAAELAAGNDPPHLEVLKLSLRVILQDQKADPYDDPAAGILVRAAGEIDHRNGSIAAVRRHLEWALSTMEEARAKREEVYAAIDVIRDAQLAAPVDGAIAAAAPGVPIRQMRGLPVIRVEWANRSEVTDQAESLLRPEFFVRDGRLVTVGDGILGPTISTATKERIADRLERLAAFFEPVQDRNDNWTTRPIPCPSWLPPVMVGKQVWPALRELRGIVRGPFIRPDGTIGGTREGYDEATRLLVVTSEDWSGLEVDPTGEDVAIAVDELRDLLRDFPFEDGTEEVGRAVWVSALLTLLARPAFEGPSPLFLFDATTAGSGKTLLAKLLAVIARGVEPPLAGMPPSPVELKKALTAALLRGDALHIFDNCTTTIGNDVLDMLLTTTNYQDRRLGTNETIVAEARMLLVATSNNAAIGADTSRRALTLRLRPKVDRPEEQEFDLDLTAYAAANRVRLMMAGLTILRWHFMQGAAGLPKLRPFGSFNGWSAAVRQAVIRAGMADPLDSQAMVRRIDDGTRLRAALLEAWEEWRPGFKGTARRLVAELFETYPSGEFLEADDTAERMRAVIMDLTSCTGRRAGSQEARRLAYIIRGMRGRIINGRSVDSDREGKEGNEWALFLPAGSRSACRELEAAGPGLPR
ncbi:MAG: hypothetical protein ACKO1M_04240 [Planctomycetota bacterium]